MSKSELSYKSVKASHYGSVDAMASYIHQDTLNEYDSTLVGITLNVPLYSGGRTSALVQQAVINKQSAELEYNSKELLLKVASRAVSPSLTCMTSKFSLSNSSTNVSDKTSSSSNSNILDMLEV